MKDMDMKRISLLLSALLCAQAWAQNFAVEGAIIALDDDQKLRWALQMVPSVSFYRYQVSFKLIRH